MFPDTNGADAGALDAVVTDAAASDVVSDTRADPVVTDGAAGDVRVDTAIDARDASTVDVRDSSIADTAGPDVRDTGAVVDTSSPVDTGVRDTGVTDSGVVDSGVIDSGVIDSGRVDSASGVDAAGATMIVGGDYCYAPFLIGASGDYAGTTCGGTNAIHSSCSASSSAASERYIVVQLPAGGIADLDIDEGFVFQRVSATEVGFPCPAVMDDCSATSYTVIGSAGGPTWTQVGVERSEGGCGSFRIRATFR